MKRQFQGKKEKRRGYIKGIIALLAMLNLVLLFIFDYRVPVLSGMMAKIEIRRDSRSEESTLDGEILTELTIEFEKDTLNYDGKDTLDLFEGVSVVDASGNIYSNDNLTVEIGGKKKKKTVTYTYSDNAGNTAEAERSLKLEDYDGPSIEVEEELPVLTEERMENLKKTYGEYCTAKDGYGLDITASVEITAEASEEEEGIYVLTFQVTNVYGDTAVETAEIEADL